MVVVVVVVLFTKMAYQGDVVVALQAADGRRG